jgi:hypothetical protein
MGLRTSLNVGRWLPDRWLTLNLATRYLSFSSRSFITDPTVEAAGSGRGRRGLTFVVARHGRAQRLTGVRLFSSYGGQFLMRFAPTGSQRRGERVYANLNRWRAAMVRRLGRCLVTVRAASSEASAPRTCAKACQAPFQLLDQPIPPIGGGKLKFGGYLGFGGFLTYGRKFALYTVVYIWVFR